MRLSRLLAVFLGALTVAACSLGGATYDPDRGLVLDKDKGSSASDNGGDSGGLTLGKLFGPSTSHRHGYAVGDEPNAVQAAIRVLNEGGSAADAATAMYFTLAVTYPVAAGLGGGGLCIIYDEKSGHRQAIDFLARDAAGGGDFAVPGNVSGFAALHATYGVLPWQRDVSPGESLAAIGFPISDALDARLQASQNVVRLDAGLAAEFLTESGKVKPAGTTVSSPALAMTIAAVREQGTNGFYGGETAQKIAAYSTREGGAISQNDLSAYRANLRAPQRMDIGSLRVYLPPDSVGAGAFAAALLGHLAGAGGKIAVSDPAGAVIRAERETLDQFRVASLPADLGATGFATSDKNGQAVACAVTMNGPFGSGHTAEGTGVTLASSPAGQTGLAAAFLTPVIATRDVTGPIRLPGEEATRALTLAGAGAGGPNGTAAIAYALLRLALGQDAGKPAELTETAAARYDTVNAIACPHGVCAVLPDPRSHGMGAEAGK